MHSFMLLLQCILRLLPRAIGALSPVRVLAPGYAAKHPRPESQIVVMIPRVGWICLGPLPRWHTGPPGPRAATASGRDRPGANSRDVHRRSDIR